MNDHVRVERLMLDLERSFRGAFLSFVQNVQSPATMRQVAELLSRNDVEGALRIIDSYIASMAPVLSTVFTEAAAQEADALATQVNRIMPTAVISFDPTKFPDVFSRAREWDSCCWLGMGRVRARVCSGCSDAVPDRSSLPLR